MRMKVLAVFAGSRCGIHGCAGARGRANWRRWSTVAAVLAAAASAVGAVGFRGGVGGFAAGAGTWGGARLGWGGGRWAAVATRLRRPLGLGGRYGYGYGRRWGDGTPSVGAAVGMGLGYALRRTIICSSGYSSYPASYRLLQWLHVRRLLSGEFDSREVSFACARGTRPKA